MRLSLSTFLLLLLFFPPKIWGQDAVATGNLVVQNYIKQIEKEKASIRSLKDQILGRKASGCRDLYSASECLRLVMQRTGFQTAAGLVEMAQMIPQCAQQDLKNSRLTKTQVHLMAAELSLLNTEKYQGSQSWLGRFQPRKAGEAEGIFVSKQNEIKSLNLIKETTVKVVADQLVKWAKLNLDAPPGSEKEKQMKKMSTIVNRLETLKKRDFNF